MTAPGPATTPLSIWLERHTVRAPEALRERAAEYAAALPPGPSIAELLAQAGSTALDRALEQPNDRSAALDLLAADALVTLALLAQAEQEPASLATFAAAIVQAHRAGT